MIPYRKSVVIILCLLFVQAWCDLALPDYTSDIIDVGIQNHGVEHILPEAVTAEEYELAQILMSINAVKGVEIGLGFESAKSSASQINDEFYYDNDKNIKTKTNNSGGILGGMSNGMPIVSRIAVKPTPSISKIQNTIDLEKEENATIEISGRHDPCICPRVTAVAESATAIILADHMIRGGFIHPTNLNKSI